LWHDVTTFEQYDHELSRRDLKRPAQENSKARRSDAAFNPGSLISETAASHILASVTERGRKLFQFIALKQLSRHTESDDKDKSNATPQAMPYSATFSAARDAFLAYNDAQMKALLSEFTDHGLIVVETAADSGSEVLWVSMLPTSLQLILQTLKSNDLQ
jgi:origin recognition complex subunit 2